MKDVTVFDRSDLECGTIQHEELLWTVKTINWWLPAGEMFDSDILLVV